MKMLFFDILNETFDKEIEIIDTLNITKEQKRYLLYLLKQKYFFLLIMNGVIIE